MEINTMQHLEKPKWQRKREKRQKKWFGIIGFILLASIILGVVFIFRNISFGGNSISSGSVITVKSGGDFQSALDRAKPGDTILLEAGATFKGAFKLPNKSGNDFITIRTSLEDSKFQPANTRLDPQKYAAGLPKIISNTKGEPAISAINGAHHYRFIGVEFGPTVEGLFNIVQIGSTEEKTIEELPHHIEFDRVYLHGDSNFGQRRGIAANGRFLKISNSYFSDFKREGEESQAIGVWATDGHIEIINNYLEAAAENILFGGAENNMKLVAGDCLIKDNWMNKPLEWRNTKWEVKNFLEIKSGRRIKIENNLFTNNWAMAQEGTGILFRSAVDSGEQAIVEDIEFANNIVRSSGSAVNIFGGEGKGGKNLKITNNVFEDINGKKYEGRGFFIKSTTFDNVLVENNTVIHDGSITIAYGEPVTNFVFRNNIVFQNEYGFFGDGGTLGKATFNKYFPQAKVLNNVIVGGNSSDYGNNNFYPASISEIGFINFNESDYRLKTNSPFYNKSIGANLDPQIVGGK